MRTEVKVVYVECESEYLTSCGEQRTLPAAIPEKRGNEKSDIPIPLTGRAYEHFYSEQRISPITLVGRVPKHLFLLYGRGPGMVVGNNER